MLTALVIATTVLPQLRTPVLWLKPDGSTVIAGKPVVARIIHPTKRVQLAEVVAWDFSNGRGSLQFGDPVELQLTGSVTVSVWLKLRSYAENGVNAQVLFRGDDRAGFDPYSLAVFSNGMISFGIQNEGSLGGSVAAEIPPVMRWFHVLANLNATNGNMELWLDKALVAKSVTAYRPFAYLDTSSSPGVSIGNIQNENGPHNQPLNGMIADLRLYKGCYRPKDIEVGKGGWDDSPSNN